MYVARFDATRGTLHSELTVGPGRPGRSVRCLPIHSARVVLSAAQIRTTKLKGQRGCARQPARRSHPQLVIHALAGVPPGFAERAVTDQVRQPRLRNADGDVEHPVSEDERDFTQARTRPFFRVEWSRP